MWCQMRMQSYYTESVVLDALLDIVLHALLRMQSYWVQFNSGARYSVLLKFKNIIFISFEEILKLIYQIIEQITYIEINLIVHRSTEQVLVF